MAKTATKKQKQRSRPVQAPKRRRQTRRPHIALYLSATIGLAVLAATALIISRGGDSGGPSATPALPQTSDYHSLLVAPRNADQLTLGTHQGLFRSQDGGRSWRQAELVGQDAMNLARPGGQSVWAAGHNVLARSGDGGATWQDVRPGGLPSLDVHAFAVDPRNEKQLYAAIAGEGTYRSTDGGKRFELVSEVGRGVMSLAVLPDGRLLAADMERQALLASRDRGNTWSPLLQAQVMGIAVNPRDPDQILASGAGVLRSTDGGRTWAQSLDLPAGSGPIAWAESDPPVAYVVGLDRSLYRTGDAGESWNAVIAGEGS